MRGCHNATNKRASIDKRCVVIKSLSLAECASVATSGTVVPHHDHKEDGKSSTSARLLQRQQSESVNKQEVCCDQISVREHDDSL